MSDTVALAIEVEPAAATALDDPATRARIGRLVSRALRPTSVGRLVEVMDAISHQASLRGRTDDILGQERAAHNAGRRDRSPAV